MWEVCVFRSIYGFPQGVVPPQVKWSAWVVTAFCWMLKVFETHHWSFLKNHYNPQKMKQNKSMMQLHPAINWIQETDKENTWAEKLLESLSWDFWFVFLVFCWPLKVSGRPVFATLSGTGNIRHSSSLDEEASCGKTTTWRDKNCSMESFPSFQQLGVEPKIGGFYPQNGWFLMENPTKRMI